jgi:hypothetical protein
MGVTATVPILTWSCGNQKRSHASYPRSRRRGSSGTVVATRVSTSGLSPERHFSPSTSSTPNGPGFSREGADVPPVTSWFGRAPSSTASAC